MHFASSLVKRHLSVLRTGVTSVGAWIMMTLGDNLLGAGNARQLGIQSACQSESRNFQPSDASQKCLMLTCIWFCV